MRQNKEIETMSDSPWSDHGLEHVPKKLVAFFDKDMFQLFEFERFLFDHVT
ncbi:MAG: hypothetical protein USCAAHI_03170 [Beijerinckiaceae bacterium]|jgi:hypothetical protein|nr:MAG: hypothetical protein USCAAHI_03170 [Beijerinckiaceae bacterium]